MGFEKVDYETVQFDSIDEEVEVGDIVVNESQDYVRYEVVDFDFSDGYVDFRFKGSGVDEISRGEVGSDLLSVWDIKFEKGEYSLL